MFEEWKTIPRLFDGETVVCIASGESLTRADCELCRELKTVIVSDVYKLAPFASVLYSADLDWWKLHNGVPDFAGIKVTHDPVAARRFGCRQILVKSAEAGAELKGVSLNPEFVHSGGNSGFQAFNLAVLFGAKRILLLGYDMQGSHFFGEHPGALRKTQDYSTWLRRFATVPPMLRDVEVINCTRATALKCFPQATLEAVL